VAVDLEPSDLVDDLEWSSLGRFPLYEACAASAQIRSAT
jgi:hypothetical protein